MKNRNQRELEKHWAEQSTKKTPAERLRMKAEKLHRQMERAKEAQAAAKVETEEPAVSAAPAKTPGRTKAKARKT